MWTSIFSCSSWTCCPSVSLHVPEFDPVLPIWWDFSLFAVSAWFLNFLSNSAMPKVKLVTSARSTLVSDTTITTTKQPPAYTEISGYFIYPHIIRNTPHTTCGHAWLLWDSESPLEMTGTQFKLPSEASSWVHNGSRGSLLSQTNVYKIHRWVASTCMQILNCHSVV